MRNQSVDSGEEDKLFAMLKDPKLYNTLRKQRSLLITNVHKASDTGLLKVPKKKPKTTLVLNIQKPLEKILKETWTTSSV